MSSSIDLSQPDYGRAKVTSRKVLKDDSDAMNDFIQSSRPPRGIHIPDPRYPRTSIPNSVPESIHKNRMHTYIYIYIYSGDMEITKMGFISRAERTKKSG